VDASLAIRLQDAISASLRRWLESLSTRPRRHLALDMEDLLADAMSCVETSALVVADTKAYDPQSDFPTSRRL